MEVVALVPAREHVCTRYRIAQFERHLAAAGLTLRFETLADTPAGRCRQMTQPRKNQAVFLVRKLIPLWQLLLLRRSAPILAYDFDDAVFYRDSFHPRGPYSLTRAVRFRATVALADLVFAGNDFLADQARRLTAGDRVQVMPTCVDPAHYSLAEHQPRDPARLVWIGSKATLPALEEARPILEQIGERLPGTVLRVICDRFPRFENLRVEPAPWSTESESGSLRSADIGISWIPDDAWSRGKCGLKILQYMAAGLPVVASAVGVHPNMLGPGAGYLARTADEWVDTIGRLAADHRLRQQMGREGRAQLENRYHVDTWGPVLAGRLAEAAAKS